jgi:hypothetical protein
MAVLALPFPAVGTDLPGQKMVGRRATAALPLFSDVLRKGGDLPSLCLPLCE